MYMYKNGVHINVQLMLLLNKQIQRMIQAHNIIMIVIYHKYYVHMSLKLNNYLAITATDVYNYYSIAKIKTIHTFTFGLTYNIMKNI